MWSRRAFLRATGALGTSVIAARPSLANVTAASAAVADRSADEVAQDESYWRAIQEAYAPDRTLINLNNGHHSPAPRVVHDALKHYLDSENQLPVYYASLINRNIERVRRALAAEFGCDPEELAITRNASESLQIAQDGQDLKEGDEVVTTDQDYPRMRAKQLAEMRPCIAAGEVRKGWQQITYRKSLVRKGRDLPSQLVESRDEQ